MSNPGCKNCFFKDGDWNICSHPSRYLTMISHLDNKEIFRGNCDCNKNFQCPNYLKKLSFAERIWALFTGRLERYPSQE